MPDLAREQTRIIGPWKPNINGSIQDKLIANAKRRERRDEQKERENAVGLRERLKHFTWAWFTSTMGTGGLAIALAVTPHRFRGLYTIGVIIFILNIGLFLLFSSLMCARFILDPKRFQRSFVHPPESFFFGSFLLSIATIIGGIQLYGITLGPSPPFLISTVRILYWIYASISLLNSLLQYYAFMQRTPARPIPMNPAWFLPGYSAMLTGTIASLIAESQEPAHKMPIILSGCAYKGFGWMLSFAFIVMYLIRLMEAGLPPPNYRPGMFIPVGSAAYTVVAFVGLARAIPRDYGYFIAHPYAIDALQAVALFFGVILWLIAFWLFSIAALACVSGVREMKFTSSWWAFVFPNVGLTAATIEIGKELGSEAILWVGSVMTIAVVVIWILTWGACGRAVWTERVLWPGRDEDKDM